MLSIGARMLQLHFGARDDGPGDPWFWIIGSAELDFKSLINLSDVNKDYRLSIKKSINEDNRKIWFRESVAPMEIEYDELYDVTLFEDIKYFKTELTLNYPRDTSNLKWARNIHTLWVKGETEASDYLKDNLNVHSLIINNIRTSAF
jgi:hypothetical protein